MDSKEPTRLTPPESSGITVGSNPYATASIMTSQPSGAVQNMRLPFTPGITSISRPSDALTLPYHGDAASGMRPCSGFSMSEPTRKKRGRPRKYAPDSNMALALSPLSASGSSTYLNAPSSDPSAKRRGRPPGSGATAFIPHVITIKAGEDVASKIMAFSQQGPRTICVLSANGAICNVTLRQPATCGGTVTYEGRFEIISLSGSFMPTENDGCRNRTGGLSVSLAGYDGRVLGGGVAGMLMAASPVQVVLGSFPPEMKKIKHDTLNPEGVLPRASPTRIVRSPSQGTSSEMSEPGSPINHSAGIFNNSSQPVQQVNSFTTMPWGVAHPSQQADASR